MCSCVDAGWHQRQDSRAWFRKTCGVVHAGQHVGATHRGGVQVALHAVHPPLFFSRACKYMVSMYVVKDHPECKCHVYEQGVEITPCEFSQVVCAMWAWLRVPCGPCGPVRHVVPCGPGCVCHVGLSCGPGCPCGSVIWACHG